MKRILGLLAVSLMIVVGLVSPASAHENTCSYSEHWSGHTPPYLMAYRFSFKDFNGRTWHHLDKMINRNWLGNYTTRAYSVDVAC